MKFVSLALLISSMAFSPLVASNAFAANEVSPGSPAPVPPLLDATAIKDGFDGRAAAEPCNNFYEFACGAWLDKTTIPSDKTGVSRQVTVASDNTDLILQNILAKYARGDFSIRASAERQLGDVYTSCLDVDKQVSHSMIFLKNEIKTIRAAKTPAQLGVLIAKLNLFGVGVFYSMGSMQDPNDSSKVIADFSQGGLSFDAKDYYFNTDAKSVEIRQKFVEHVANVFKLLGSPTPEAEAIAASILKFETALAKGEYALEDSYDPIKTNHPTKPVELQKLAPRIDFKSFFRTLDLTAVAHMNVDEPEYLQNLNSVLAATAGTDVANYVIFRFVDSLSPRIGGDLKAEQFAFWSAYMEGAKQPLPLWKQCTGVVKDTMGLGLAEAYVKTFDGADIKRRTEAMITNIKQTFKDDLQELNKSPDAWIDDSTLKGADDKVDAIAQKVGAPSKFRDYSSVKITGASLLENQLRLNIFETKRSLKKIGRAVDKTEWGMMPWEINAYYDRSNNEFVFPFGILMPPSLDFTFSEGANYGAFGGGTIGHELTHGFDNNGQKYDSKGNLRNWWTPATNAAFAKKSQCYIDQANNYEIAQVQLKVDGAQTLEENLADQGGVKLGYKALEKILAGRPESTPWQGRYSERQQYWIGYAQSWCTKQTDASLRSRMSTDPHPPAEFRVNAVMMNRPEFAHDFNCPVAAPMNPANRCSLW